MDLKRKISNNISDNNKILDKIPQEKSKKIKETVYIGKRQFLLLKDINKFNLLHQYIAHCFDSIYSLLPAQNVSIDIVQAPYTIILQFLYAIAEFNNKLNFIPRGKTIPLFVDSSFQNYEIKYKILTSPSIMRAECMWVDDSNTIIFHEKLIKSLLKGNNNEIDITIDKEIEENSITTPEYWQHAADLIVVPRSALTKLSILFAIAEHAAIHILENNHEYIQHKNWKSTSILTLSSVVAIKPIGNLSNIEKMLLDQQNTRGIIFQI
jgi:hypothetical protein